MSRWATATLVACMALGSAALGAQTTATGSISAQAEVGTVVTLSNPTSIDFGSLLAGGSSPNVAPVFSAGIPHAGSIQVDLSGGTFVVNVTIDPGNELTRNGSSPPLTTVLACGVGNSATDANAEAIGCEGQNFSVVQSGERWIFVGGQTTAPADAKSGTYRGTVTVRVSATAQ